MTLPTERYREEIYAVLRIVVGFLFFWHGTQKLFGFPVPSPFEVPAVVVYIAGPIELVGGAFIAIGLFTQWAAFLSSGLMAFGYFLAHAPKGLLPILNGGDLSVLYCFIFLYISARGSGIWSLDGRNKKHK